MAPITNAAVQHGCGGTLEIKSEAGTFRIHGVDVAVDLLFYRCDTCNEELVTEELAERVETEAATRFRQQERYMTGAEIRALRERFGLKQEDFEAALGLGAKSLARWENERVLQNRGMDNLLRLIQRDPSALVFLAQENGITLPTTPGVSAARLIDVSSWPRDLVAQLECACAAQGTDLNSYLLWFLSTHTSVSSTIDRVGRDMHEQVRSQIADHLQEVQRSVSDRDATWSHVEEPWRERHLEAMREARGRAANTEYAS